MTAEEDKPRKYVIGNRVTVSISRERVQYLDGDGKLVTESLKDFTRINLQRKYESLDQFLQAWSGAARKAALVEELQHHGVLLDVLTEELAQEKARAVRWPRPTRWMCCCTWPMTSPCSPAVSAPGVPGKIAGRWHLCQVWRHRTQSLGSLDRQIRR